jgi:hypothetical protein
MGKLKRYGIYHPKDGTLNGCCKLDTHQYEYITAVLAENLTKVFMKAQNDFSPEYASLGKRSTSVGDIITANTSVYMVNGIGLKKVSSDTQLYKDIMQTDEAIIEILSRRTLSQDDIDDLVENSY